MNPFNFLSMPDYSDPMKVNGPFSILQQKPMPQNQPYIPPPQMQMPSMLQMPMDAMSGMQNMKQGAQNALGGMVQSGVSSGAQAMGVPKPIADILGKKAGSKIGSKGQIEQAPQLGPLPQFQQMANGADGALQMFRGLLG